MTCEVAILNKFGIALAADSAMTTTSTTLNGENKERYFKGSNKIFQISSFNPVGVMIYGDAFVQTVPMEIIIKEFRKHLGSKNFKFMQEYADEFFRFSSANFDIFPKNIRDDFISMCAGFYWMDVIKTSLNPNVILPTSTNQEKIEAVTYEMGKRSISLGNELFGDLTGVSFLDKLCEKHQEGISQQIIKFLEALNIDNFDKKSELARSSLEALCKRYKHICNTGLVFAGYGEKDIYPHCTHYTYGGNLLNTSIHDKKDAIIIDNNTPSSMQCFAKQEMITTFMYGMSDDIYIECIKIAHESMEMLLKNMGIDVDDKIRGHIDSSKQYFSSQWIAKAVEKHRHPLTSVIEKLPFKDMAELAETLVALESLKEKVSQNSESVGGPVDVAIISKGDGFVWIKRKHYFDPEINSRYFHNQRRSYGKG